MDLVSKVISPLIGVISNYKYSYLIYNLVTKSHDPEVPHPMKPINTSLKYKA